MAKFRLTKGARRETMNVTAHRNIGLGGISGLGPAVDAGPGQPGPRPPPKHLSARALTALVSQLTTGHAESPGLDVAPGPLDPYIRKALERTAVGTGIGASLWR